MHNVLAAWHVIANGALTCWLLSKRKLPSYFSPIVDQRSPDYVSRRRRDRSLQHRFPIVDNLFRSGDIRDQSAKSSEIVPKKHVFRTPNFSGEDPQMLELVFKIAPISNHVAKFCGDWPRDRGDLAQKKKRKKETAAKHKGLRIVLSQRAALITFTAAVDSCGIQQADCVLCQWLLQK